MQEWDEGKDIFSFFSKNGVNDAKNKCFLYFWIKRVEMIWSESLEDGLDAIIALLG